VDNSLQLRIFTEPQQGASYAGLLKLARFTEAAGYDAFFRSDHYLKMGDTDGLPGPTDAWITLAGLARDTETVRLGTLVTAATFRHPGPLAISVAQVDEMSGGRVEFGLGSGWYAAEHAAYGLDFPDLGERFDRYSEQLDIITGLWRTPAGQTFDYRGKHYTLTDSPALPKPAQPDGPPVIIGGGGKKRTPALAAQHAAEFNVAFVAPDAAAEQFGRVDAACTAIGRDPATMIRSAAMTVAVGRDEAELARRAAAIGRDLADNRFHAGFGTPAEVVDKLGKWREQTGISRAYLQVLDIHDLDHVELIASEVAPQLR
jgi:F420-dependent oxidoreductase-like protein